MAKHRGSLGIVVAVVLLATTNCGLRLKIHYLWHRTSGHHFKSQRANIAVQGRLEQSCSPARSKWSALTHSSRKVAISPAPFWDIGILDPICGTMS